MNVGYVSAVIVAMAFVTLVTRATPFLIDRRLSNTRWAERLRTNLPSALLVCLLAYCLRTVALTDLRSGLPSVAGVVACFLLQYGIKSELLSIVGGTVAYILLRGLTADS